jgi:hypothetical protein
MESFVNFSNHPSADWSSSQLERAGEYGTVVDVPFPAVPADCSEEAVAELGEQCIEAILKCRPAAVMCQGEFTLAFYVAEHLMDLGIPVLSACSERKIVRQENDGGGSTKTLRFEFVRFREYRR